MPSITDIEGTMTNDGPVVKFITEPACNALVELEPVNSAGHSDITRDILVDNGDDYPSCPPSWTHHVYHPGIGSPAERHLAKGKYDLSISIVQEDGTSFIETVMIEL